MALRGIALGRKSWLFAGSDRGGQRAAAMYSLIATAKLNDVDPQAWLADVLARINDLPASRLDELLPWNWDPAQAHAKRRHDRRDQKIVRLKIVLDEVEPTVERWIIVPLKIPLDRLHEVLQAAMGWTNSHLWEIRIRDLGWGPVDPENLFGDGPSDAPKTTLQQALAQTGAKRFTYLYDFGDGWSHTVKLDRFETLPAGIDATFLVYAKGPCPPEDCGGPFGYAELLDAYGDPAHEAHHDALEILGPRFNPAADTTTDRYEAVHQLVGRWIRKPRKPR